MDVPSNRTLGGRYVRFCATNGGLFSSFAFRSQAARCDKPEAWRFSQGGQNPATPIAESIINYHQHAVSWMVVVVCTVMYMLKCRI
ncbi:hypothetical protein IE077_000162 [Cardiosporidium cionae]|uniref:Uncharacterized protein n=1 Tax=Cardiosporidium cionae TaxID=476202 RepID=A0ABQ7J5C6_9APIC|nr:hypothetical protein IE077_000162 [Cardiosporidium cionae]|eukprot:KAF8819193.1 hypothetical protein IE077_000162 [Cardiosporidium cionae]